jgi:transglutaminase-like putative cysteine protease
MSTILEVRHRTTYSYASPVNFGEHRLMFRPLAGHDLRVIDWDLTTNVPWRSHWIQDTFSNSVAVVTFQEPAAELTFVCRFSVEHYGVRDHELPLEARAEKLPLELTPDEWIDLQGFLRPHSRDAIGSVAAWAREMLRAGNHETRPVLQHMVDYMRQQFVYQAREVEGTQEPHETLRLRSGTCRDYAWLMIEAVRCLGLAARFVSGYFYDPALDGGAFARAGSGSTHAWLNVYLPGAGWVHYDPTNRLTAGQELIRVAIARHPAQAAPLSGSWVGNPADYRGMAVEVDVRRIS